MNKKHRNLPPVNMQPRQPILSGQGGPALVQVEARQYRGPLPHPEMLQKYEQIVPGGAERIFKEFEREAAHRRSSEDQTQRHRFVHQLVGQLSGFVIAIAGTWICTILIREGKSVAGLVAMLAPLTGLVGVLVAARRRGEPSKSGSD